MPNQDASLLIRPCRSGDEHEIIGLWRTAGLVVPHNDPHRDIAAKLAFQPDLFWVGLVNGCLTATLMAGYDGHRGWINYLAVSPDHRRQGIGRRMLRHAETRLNEMGCPKINLQVRLSNQAVIAFYRAVGYSEDEVISMGKRIRQ